MKLTIDENTLLSKAKSVDPERRELLDYALKLAPESLATALSLLLNDFANTTELTRNSISTAKSTGPVQSHELLTIQLINQNIVDLWSEAKLELSQRLENVMKYIAAIWYFEVEFRPFLASKAIPLAQETELEGVLFTFRPVDKVEQ